MTPWTLAKRHMVYKLDPVDASERKLVKQIEVASMEVDGGHNRPFVRFLSAADKKGTICAKVELDVKGYLATLPPCRG